MPLAGKYGDVIWDAPSTIDYVPGTEIVCDIYVMNPTAIDRQYMLMVTIVDSSTGKLMAQYAVSVDNALWFTVDAGDLAVLPGAITSDYTGAVATLSLYEKELGDVADSASIILVSTGAALPTVPGLPFLPTPEPGYDFSGILGLVMMFMLMGMVMQMTRGMYEEKPEEKKKSEQRR